MCDIESLAAKVSPSLKVDGYFAAMWHQKLLATAVVDKNDV